MEPWEGAGHLLRSQSREGLLDEGEEDVSWLPWLFALMTRVLIMVLVSEASPAVVLEPALSITDIAGLPNIENLVRIVIGVVYTLVLLVVVTVADRRPPSILRLQLDANMAKVGLLALAIAGVVVAASAYLVF